MTRPQPHPIPARRCKSPDRRFLCDHYDDCLDRAVAGDWSGFSCRDCRAYVQVNYSHHEWQSDALACTALIHMALKPASYLRRSPGLIIDRVSVRGVNPYAPLID